jgi:Ca-activated chloride channel family protein
MKKLVFRLVVGLGLVGVIGLGALCAPLRFALADGFIIPDPSVPSVNLAVKEHHVTVDIDNSVAKVHIDQTFNNPNDFDINGTYIFPIPTNATLSTFTMKVDGESVTGEVMDAEKAKTIYEDYVMKMIDPLLLEYVGDGMYKTSIYPIEAKADIRVELDYVQTLSSDSGYLKFWYPLATEKYSSSPLSEVSISFDITNSQEIKTVYSPTHPTSTNIKNVNEATASYEATNATPDKDYELLIGLSSEDFGAHVASYNDGDGDGYFMMTVSSKNELTEDEIMPKDIVFVLDVSGSMYGVKLDQAKEALNYILDEIEESSPEDRFNVISFSDYIDAFSGTGLLEANEANLALAKDFVDDLEAIGGTDINSAVSKALEFFDPASTNSKVIVFLTDGEPTVGEIDDGKILTNVSDANAAVGARIFTFGLGDKVNTHLLDSISLASRAYTNYVLEDALVEEGISSFYNKIAFPILTDVELKFLSNIGEYDLFPDVIPDFYKGSQLILFGRYKTPSASIFTITGKRGGSEKTYSYSASFTAGSKNFDYIPTLWAARKIGYLMDEIRLNGESAELKNSIIELSKKFGIITEYTSFLVDENATGSASDNLSKSFSEMGFSEETGENAFDAATGVQMLKNMDSAQSALEASESVSANFKTVGSKTFYLKDGRWVDNDYSGGAVTTLDFASQAYFDLVTDNPAIGDYFALSQNVTACVDGVCYATYGEGKTLVFSDILGHWAYKLIIEYNEDGIVGGYKDGTFKPNASVSRAEFIKIAVDALTKTTSKLMVFGTTSTVPDVASTKFTDVAKDAWYLSQLNFALENKLISGYPDGTFKPNNPITRIEAVTILARIFENNGNIDLEEYVDDSHDFTDISALPEASVKYVDLAYGLALTKGYTDKTFRPFNNVSRAETLSLVDNSINSLVEILVESLK